MNRQQRKQNKVHIISRSNALTLIYLQHYPRPQQHANNLNLPDEGPQDPSFLGIYQQDQVDPYSSYNQPSTFHHGQYAPASGLMVNGQYITTQGLAFDGQFTLAGGSMPNNYHSSTAIGIQPVPEGLIAVTWGSHHAVSQIHDHQLREWL